MLIFNPKILALLALLGFGGLMALGPRTPALRAPARVVHVGGEKTAGRLATETDAFDQLKAASRLKAETQQKLDPIDTRKPPPPKEEYSVDLLLRVMQEGLKDVPGYVPNLPFMTSLARAMIETDPNSIREGPLPPGTLGQFSWHDPKHLSITISPDVRRLHEKGVPARLLAPVLVHELDHMIGYLYRRKHPGETRHDAEQSAFRSEGLYLFGLSFKHKDGVETVEATDYDPEKKAYMDELKKLRQKMFAGELPQFINERYGKDDDVLKREDRR